MLDNKYEIEDLIGASIDQKPLDFANIFNDLIKDRLNASVDNRKLEIAKGMYDPTEPEEEIEDNSEEESDGETA
jgi:hypothetical protein